MSEERTKCYLPDYKLVVSTFQQIIGYEILLHNIPDIWLETKGEEITVAVLDTGCQTDHPDLIDATIQGWNFHDDIQPVADGNGHGTHVTGTITANNNDVGVVGVAPLAKVLVIKVLGDEGEGYFESVAKGILFAIEQKSDIISMSLGAPVGDNAVHQAIQKAYEQHIPCVCAAGNSGDVGALDFPGRYPETIAIGALNNKNLRAEFSQTGSRLDFMAPGVDIFSTYPNNQYAGLSGTSMATPWAAGVVALMIAKHRKIGGKTPLHTVEDIREHLKKTSLDLDVAGKDPKTGFGLIDVEKAIQQIEQGEKEMPNQDIQTLIDQVNTWLNSFDEKYSLRDTINAQIAELQAQITTLTAEIAAFEEKAGQIRTIIGQ